MKMLKIIALTAVLATGATAAYATPFDAMGGVPALQAVGQAQSATVLTVNPAEARSLKIDTDTAALQSRINDNQYLLQALSAQGYSASDVVGIGGGSTNVTLYVL